MSVSYTHLSLVTDGAMHGQHMEPVRFQVIQKSDQFISFLSFIHPVCRSLSLSHSHACLSVRLSGEDNKLLHSPGERERGGACLCSRAREREGERERDDEEEEEEEFS